MFFSSFVIFYHCDETPFVGVNLSYSKSSSRPPGFNYTDDDLDLFDVSKNNFNHECTSTNSYYPVTGHNILFVWKQDDTNSSFVDRLTYISCYLNLSK